MLLKYLNLNPIQHKINLNDLYIASRKNNATNASYNPVVNLPANLPGYVQYRFKNIQSPLHLEILNLFPQKFHSYLLRISENMPESIKNTSSIRIQCMGKDWNNFIHIDPRSYTINYTLLTGGDSVITSFLTEDKSTIIESHNIPLHKWHWFDTKINHKVTGIETTRVQLTISIPEEIDIPEDFLLWLNEQSE
jgi:hypothetical protein